MFCTRGNKIRSDNGAFARKSGEQSVALRKIQNHHMKTLCVSCVVVLHHPCGGAKKTKGLAQGNQKWWGRASNPHIKMQSILMYWVSAYPCGGAKKYGYHDCGILKKVNSSLRKEIRYWRDSEPSHEDTLCFMCGGSSSPLRWGKKQKDLPCASPFVFWHALRDSNPRPFGS